ncbi:MAG: glycosyltransferase family 2 protein [Lachnospiraceae bacterium]|nr:glycosyltransferase family 2 protein [Lachnospiraceae bacterium]
MEKRPLISVIIPIYNAEDTIEKCVRSVLSQTYRELEIILVDDGSLDSSGEIIDRLAAQAPRIVVRHTENGGSSRARNVGISMAHGLYLGFVDSDDYIAEDMYAKLYEAIEDNDISQAGRDEIASDGTRLPDICKPPEEKAFLPSAEFMREILMHRGDCSMCTKLIKRELLDRVYRETGEYFPQGRLNEDFHIFIRMLPRTKGVVCLPEQLYHVYYKAESNSRRKDKNEFPRVFADCVDNADMAAEIVKENYPHLKGVAFRFGVFQRLEYLLHIPVMMMTKDNAEYRNIVRWMRRRLFLSVVNPYLTVKNKLYHLLFAIAPAGIRKLHRRVKGLA